MRPRRAQGVCAGLLELNIGVDINTWQPVSHQRQICDLGNLKSVGNPVKNRNKEEIPK